MGSSKPESWTDAEWAEWAREHVAEVPTGLSTDDRDFVETVHERIGDPGVSLTVFNQAERVWKFAKLSRAWKLRYFNIMEEARRTAALEEADRRFPWLTPGMKRALGGATVVVVLASGITYAVTRDGPTPVDEPSAAQPELSPAPVGVSDDEIETAEGATEPEPEPDTADEPSSAEQSAEASAEPDTAEPDSSDGAAADAVPNGWDDVGDNGPSGRPPAEGGDGADARLFEVFIGSTVFELTVEGDGETMSTAPTTRWYNPRFIVNNDPSTNVYDDESGFSVDVTWDRDGVPEADVRDAQNELVPGVSVDVAWVTPSLLRVVVDRPDGNVPVTRARLELSVRTQDDAGNTIATFEDDAFWEAEN